MFSFYLLVFLLTCFISMSPHLGCAITGWVDTQKAHSTDRVWPVDWLVEWNPVYSPEATQQQGAAAGQAVWSPGSSIHVDGSQEGCIRILSEAETSISMPFVWGDCTQASWELCVCIWTVSRNRIWSTQLGEAPGMSRGSESSRLSRNLLRTHLGSVTAPSTPTFPVWVRQDPTHFRVWPHFLSSIQVPSLDPLMGNILPIVGHL